MKRLAEALLLKREVTAGVRICSSLDMLENLLEIGEVQALLISDEIPYELRKRVFGGRRIVLTRTKCADLGEEEQELRKYQSVDKLTAGFSEDGHSGGILRKRPCSGSVFAGSPGR